jgi:hypothetical protein
MGINWHEIINPISKWWMSNESNPSFIVFNPALSLDKVRTYRENALSRDPSTKLVKAHSSEREYERLADTQHKANLR